jgi:nucleotidyltransferase substrate binding protein (TIGR01987 family)
MNDPIISAIRDAAKPYRSIEKLVLFGSRARGDNHPKSDYDIAVFTSDSWENLTRFMDTIDDLDTLYKIDLVIIREDTSPELIKNIEKEGITIMTHANKVSNYIAAVSRLKEALTECGDYPSTLNRDGVIQRFEFCMELAWKACREYLMDMGIVDINAPKPVLKEAFSYGLIDNERSQTWITMLRDRNLTSHVYDDTIADEIFHRIKDNYLDAFIALADKFETLV